MYELSPTAPLNFQNHTNRPVWNHIRFFLPDYAYDNLRFPLFKRELQATIKLYGIIACTNDNLMIYS